ncbi:MAG: MFS transporter, partial [Mycobacterium sp.]
QRDLLYSPLATGVAFLPMAAGIGLAAALANTVLMRRVGPRPIIPTGMVVAAAGMAWLGRLGVDATYTRDILGPIVLLGVGMGLAFSPAVATATSGVATRDAGVASAMVNTSQQIGGTVGTAACRRSSPPPWRATSTTTNRLHVLSRRLGPSTGTQSRSISQQRCSLLGPF